MSNNQKIFILLKKLIFSDCTINIYYEFLTVRLIFIPSRHPEGSGGGAFRRQETYVSSSMSHTLFHHLRSKFVSNNFTHRVFNSNGVKVFGFYHFTNDIRKSRVNKSLVVE